ncbi:hypothetical protein Hoch_0950 [Haliangium ochraceum DSM 14365]|uniref:Uncharacterized protein n=1 Tax=Haliangium ochraceum (strain DSM 14365 / JCM 11303 / SMP-2) TaxID=502025 RepID=D0LQJ3_HALO1|nr:hypothetical protein Hoch_0950 [Haliangium ochraceum DSM 14365]
MDVMLERGVPVIAVEETEDEGEMEETGEMEGMPGWEETEEMYIWLEMKRLQSL